MILGGLLGNTLYRFAALAWPIANDTLGYLTWCHPRHGITGTHNDNGHGTCTTCKRPVR